jgi:hypothetical protein
LPSSLRATRPFSSPSHRKLRGIGAILPQANLGADYWYQANGFLIRNSRPEDVIVTEGGFLSANYLSLYTGAKIVSPYVVETEQLRQIFERPRAGRVWILSWAFEPPPEVRRMVLHRARVASGKFMSNETCLDRVRARMIKRDETAFQVVWELIPAQSLPRLSR